MLETPAPEGPGPRGREAAGTWDWPLGPRPLPGSPPDPPFPRSSLAGGVLAPPSGRCGPGLPSSAGGELSPQKTWMQVSPSLTPKPICDSVAPLQATSMWQPGVGVGCVSDVQTYPCLSAAHGFPAAPSALEGSAHAQAANGPPFASPGRPVPSPSSELFLEGVFLRAYLAAFAQAVPSIWSTFPCLFPSIALSPPAGPT